MAESIIGFDQYFGRLIYCSIADLGCATCPAHNKAFTKSPTNKHNQIFPLAYHNWTSPTQHKQFPIIYSSIANNLYPITQYNRRKPPSHNSCIPITQLSSQHTFPQMNWEIPSPFHIHNWASPRVYQTIMTNIMLMLIPCMAAANIKLIKFTTISLRSLVVTPHTFPGYECPYQFQNRCLIGAWHYYVQSPNSLGSLDSCRAVNRVMLTNSGCGLTNSC